MFIEKKSSKNNKTTANSDIYPIISKMLFTTRKNTTRDLMRVSKGHMSLTFEAHSKVNC